MNFLEETVVPKVTGLHSHSIEPGKLHQIEFLKLNWDGYEDRWNATVTYERGVPVYISWYEYELSEENFQMHLRELLEAGRYKLGDVHGGNGHGDARIELA